MLPHCCQRTLRWNAEFLLQNKERDEYDVGSEKHDRRRIQYSGYPSAPQAAMYVKVEETGSVLLSSKVAEKLAKMPVQIRFNKDCTAIQICIAGSGDSVTFPKSGRKTVPNAAKILRENRIQFPAIFNGEICGENAKWRGELQVNPTGKPSQTIRSTRKK